MQILAAAQNTKPDYVALAMVLVLAVIVAVMVIKKRFFTKEKAPTFEIVQEESTVKTEAPGAAGEIKLHNVEPKIAAMLMAIVADKMNKPLNELRFISIKEVE